MSMLRGNEDAQRKGWVAVVLIGETNQNSSEVVKRGSELRNHLPMKQAASHVCYQQGGLSSLFMVGLQAISKYTRARVRFHVGSVIECRYGLMDFGIPTHVLPVEAFGKTNTAQHVARLQRLREKELSAASKVRTNRSGSTNNGGFSLPVDPMLVSIDSAMMEQLHSNRYTDTPSPIEMPPPQQNDVLLGRGVVVMNHPGNLFYRELIATYSDAYDSGSKFDKTVIAEMVIKKVNDAGGRFLKPLSGTSTSGGINSDASTSSTIWEEVDYHAARLKVASAFRFVRKQRKRKQKTQM